MLENTLSASKSDALTHLQNALGDALFFAKTEEIKPHYNATATIETAGTNQVHGYKKQRKQQEQKALATLFPNGLPTDELIELLYRGSGCASLAFCFARSVSRDGRGIAVIDTEHQFYPHTALALGIELAQLFILRPPKGIDEMWVLDQAIRCRGFSTVLWRGEDRGEQIHIRHLRRLQLACQKHNTLGLLLRPRSMTQQSTAAKTRLLVESVRNIAPKIPANAIRRATSGGQPFTPRDVRSASEKQRHRSSFFFHRLRIQRLRGAHLTTGSGVVWEIDHEHGTFRQTPSLHVAS